MLEWFIAASFQRCALLYTAFSAVICKYQHMLCIFLLPECWSVDINGTEKAQIFWEIGKDLGKEQTTQK